MKELFSDSFPAARCLLTSASQLCSSYLRHEVARVPSVQLSFKRQISLLTLLLLQFEDDCALFVAQRLQLTSQLLCRRRQV